MSGTVAGRGVQLQAASSRAGREECVTAARRSILGLCAMSLLLALAVGARLLLGRGAESFVFGWPESGTILALRVNAVSAALVAGGALGASGLLLQTLLRNPLASPFILGLSAGATLGMSVAVWASISYPAAAWLLSGGALLPAALGALSSLLLVILIGRRGGTLDALTLVLAGVIVSSLAGGLTLLVQHSLPIEMRGRIDLWLLGRIPEAGAGATLWVCGVVTAGGVALAWRMGRAMDAASLSDAEAISIGVNLPRLRLALLGVSALLAAAATALCGPLAFIGLVGPHMARLLCGARHRSLVAGSVMAGALLLLGADALRQVVDLGAGRLPIGVITAVLGSIAFLWLLRRFRPVMP